MLLQVAAVIHLEREQQVEMLGCTIGKCKYIESRCPDAIGGSNNLPSQDELESQNAGWVKKDEQGLYVGARKLWGTMNDAMEEAMRE